MVLWDDLGFATRYEVDSSLEYPGDGNWGMPVVPVEFGPALPTPGPIAIIRPDGVEPWVLSEQVSQWTAIYGTPDPDRLCVLVQYERAVLIDVRQPSDQTLLPGYVVSIAGSLDEGLLLLCDWWSITAIGIDGVRWRTDRLVLDDLHVTRTKAGRIYFRGSDVSGEIRGALDAASGKPLR